MERIGLFLPDLRTGGAQHVFIALAKEFSLLGYEVDLVAAATDGSMRTRIPEGVKLFDLKSPLGIIGKAGFAIAATYGLSRYLRMRKPSALLSTLTGTNIVAVCARTFSRERVRLVLREAVTFANMPGSLRQRLIRRIYPSADQIVAVSRGVADDLAKMGIEAGQIQIIFNPADPKKLHRLSLGPMDESLIDTDDRPIVLGIGRLEPQKDFRTLLLAFSRVLKRRHAQLVILGEGSLRTELRNLAEELSIHKSVALPGELPNPYPYLRRASVFVLSSRWEGYPNALIEALALNTPVVATDCHSGPAEILGMSGCGELVPPGDDDAMSRAIGKSLSYEGFCQPHPSFFHSHSIDNITHRYLSALGLST